MIREDSLTLAVTASVYADSVISIIQLIAVPMEGYVRFTAVRATGGGRTFVECDMG